MDRYKLVELVENELKKIVDKGLNTANLDTAYKLVDMYKDLCNMDYWDNEMEDGYSAEGYGYRNSRANRGKHYVRGHYSRTGYDDGTSASYDKYMSEKRNYRSNKSESCKNRLMESLEDYMDDFTARMEDLADDADCAEERDTIQRYISKIKSLR